jgi:mannose-6-phosphate isomerase-like protein (cupin superfamily)
MSENPIKRKAVVLRSGEGRSYAMGRMNAVYKADGDETRSQYEVSEWSLQPHTQGPGAHSHDNDDVFYVLEGTMTFLVEGKWVEAPRGSFVLVPGGMTHDFKNTSDAKATILNIGVPGGFEKGMPQVVKYFEKNPPDDA